MIVDYSPKPLTFSYLNVESATFRGVEFQTRLYLLTNLTTTLSYNFTDIVQDNEDVAISKISPHTAALRLVYGFFNNKFRVSLRDQFFSNSEIMVVVGHTGDLTKVKKDGYHVLELMWSYKLNKLLAFKIGATNLNDFTDQDYCPFSGRRIFVGITNTFERN